MQKTTRLPITIFALCIGTAATVQHAQAADQSITIGEIRPLTGPVNYYGIGETRAVQVAISEINVAGGVKINGQNLKLVLQSEDDQASPTTGVAALRKLMTDKVRYVLGPLASGVASALKPIVQNNPDITEIIDGATGGPDQTNGKNMFRNQTSIKGFEDPLIVLAKAKAYPTVAMITDRFHAADMQGEPALAAEFDKQGNKIVAREYFKMSDIDFTSQLTKIKQMNPAALFFGGYITEAALMTKQARQLGFKGDIIWALVGPPTTVLKNISAAEMEGVLDSFPSTVEDFAQMGQENAKRMNSAYIQMFKDPPGELSGLSYDAVYMLKTAMEKANSVDNAKVNAALAGLKVSDVPQLISSYEPLTDGRLFDNNGQVEMRGGLHIWHGTHWVTYKP